MTGGSSPRSTSPSARRLLERGASELGSAGVGDARFEAELLLRHALGCSRESLLARLQDTVSAEAAGHYLQLVERRRGHVPIQHILGTQEFFGLSFRVTPDVLIPRPETEGVVEAVLAELGSSRNPRIADVGCGSGCIGVAIAHEHRGASVVAIDASPAALAVARENALRHGVSERMQFLLGDLLEPLLGSEGRIDAIVSNPPYVSDAELLQLEPEVAEHEPRIALAGGADGLSVIGRLLHQARSVIATGGFLVMEIGKGQVAQVSEKIEDAGLELLRFVPDLAGVPRVAVARRR